jgi:hypothetical protein
MLASRPRLLMCTGVLGGASCAVPAGAQADRDDCIIVCLAQEARGLGSRAKACSSTVSLCTAGAGRPAAGGVSWKVFRCLKGTSQHARMLASRAGHWR